SLQPEEPVEATMKRLFGSRPIRVVPDDGGPIKLDLPLIAEDGAVVPITVEVKSPMTPERHVKAISVISDRNRRPLNARFAPHDPPRGQGNRRRLRRLRGAEGGRWPSGVRCASG